MATNVIKQIVRDDEFGAQTIKMIVHPNERGAQGERGEQGQAATIEAGQAYSIPAGSEPAVMNTGSDSNAVFDFYIPRGGAKWGDIIGDISEQADLEPYLEQASSAIQPEDINYTIVQDLGVDSNTSTSTLQLDAAKVNLMSGTVSSKDIPLPVASSTEAGIMNSSTFDAVATNSANIANILSGMVAIDNLPVTPTQAELTTAWQEASGLTTVTNYAHILDTSNDRYWTYFTNTSTWYSNDADIMVTIAPFTNNTDGTIKGSTNVGQVFAESDGTGSVNGWDALDARVTTNTNNMVSVKTVLSQPSSVAYVDTANIVDEAVTTDKLADEAITIDKIDSTSYNTNSFPVINTTALDANINSDTYYDQYTYTVQYAGTYIVAFSQRLKDGTDSRELTVRITNNGQEVSSVTTGGSTWVNWISGTVIAIVRASVGDVIKCQSKGGGTGVFHTGNGVVSLARIY